MRQAGIEAFLFASARVKQVRKNVAAFSSNVFAKKREQLISRMQNWRCLANSINIEFTRTRIIKNEKLAFSRNDFE